MTEPATLILRASLRARLYRDIEVSSSSMLADLAEAIVAAYGFDMDHAYGFYSKLTGKLFDSHRRFELFADIEGSGSRSVYARHHGLSERGLRNDFPVRLRRRVALPR
jgi:hypothetical protein